jgi:heavy metal sensor kinase
MRLRPTNVRARLTLWYVLVLAAFLILYAAGTSTLLLWDLRSQLTRYAVQDIETVEGLLSFDAAGKLIFREDYHNHPESKLIQERYLEVLIPNGAVLFRNDRLGTRDLGGSVFAREGSGGYSERNEHLSDGTRVLLLSRQHSIDGRPILIRLAYSQETLYSQWRQLLWALAAGLPLALACAGLASYLLAKRALQPLEKMAARAERINADYLDERLPVENPEDELGQLGRIFNLVLDRLQRSFDQLKHFTSDASHELRTPLASIRSVGEVALQRNLSRDEYRDTIGSMLEESARLTQLVDNLLTVSRADAGEIPFNQVRLPTIACIQEAASLLAVLLEEKSQRLTITGDNQISVQADPVILRQAFVNVLHNAVKYSPERGEISVQVRQEASQVQVAITDNGPGISAEHRERIFDRFYRVDRSRSRDQGGAGLGLAIAKWALEVHGGTIQLAHRDQPGTTFVLTLPK